MAMVEGRGGVWGDVCPMAHYHRFCPRGVHACQCSQASHIPSLPGPEVWKVLSTTDAVNGGSGPEASGSPHVAHQWHTTQGLRGGLHNGTMEASVNTRYNYKHHFQVRQDISIRQTKRVDGTSGRLTLFNKAVHQNRGGGGRLSKCQRRALGTLFLLFEGGGGGGGLAIKRNAPAIRPLSAARAAAAQ